MLDARSGNLILGVNLESNKKKNANGKKDVLDLILTGLSNRGTAEKLGISVKGVKYHITNILRENGVKTVKALIVKSLTEDIKCEVKKA